MKLFQINLTREETDRVNKGEAVDKYKAYCDAAILGKFPGPEFYQHVADIHTDDLDYAFEVGNVGPESKLTRHARMHSVSVGDVLLTGYGVALIVKAVGFEAVDWPAQG